MNRSFSKTALAVIALSLFACGSEPPTPQPADRPNFLFLLADQWRGDAIGADGNDFVHTPIIDKLAAEGVRFAAAYTPQAVCTPARASLLTGVYPTTHRVDDNVYGIPSVFALPEYDLRPNYPELLREAGYFTGYIGKWHLGEDDPGLFDFWAGYNSQKPHWLGEKYKSQYRAEAETEQALEFLDSNKDRPFFLEVSYYPPHTPYEAPEEFHRFYEGQDLKHMQYYAACTAIDTYIGRLLARLDELGLRNNTMVLFTSEHGETFRERPLSSNKRVGYEESARIPMIVRYPAGLPAGVVFEGGLTNMDLMPMMLEASGLPIPESLHGKSRMAAIRDGDTGWTEPVFQQNRTQPGIDDGPHDERMVRLGEWKLIVRRYARPRPPETGDELFNLSLDPKEVNNRIAEPEMRAKVRELAGLLHGWGLRIGDPVAVQLANRYFPGGQ